MAGGMFTKQADFLSARFLNDVNDAVLGGQLTTVPSTIPGSQGNATLPGDRILLDDATALALSDTAVGTLYGGLYEYVQTLSSATATPAVGTAAFFRAADIGVSGSSYIVTSDAQTSTAIPTYFAGVFINAVTKGNYGWIQIGGVASCLFDSALTATAAGNWVTVKVSSAVASCFDCGAVAGVVTLAAMVGVAVGLPATSTVSKVAMFRFPARY